MKKILITNFSIVNFAGSEINCITIAKRLKELGYEVYIASLEFGSPIYDVVKNDLDVDYEIIPQEGEYNVPILGNIDPKAVSLPLVAVIIGFIDGFNPCAMWVLLFLLSIFNFICTFKS